MQKNPGKVCKSYISLSIIYKILTYFGSFRFEMQRILKIPLLQILKPFFPFSNIQPFTLITPCLRTGAANFYFQNIKIQEDRINAFPNNRDFPEVEYPVFKRWRSWYTQYISISFSRNKYILLQIIKCVFLKELSAV